MRRLILGTAGHIDHGKTALVKALTGVDTDRLKEEKERGITVDLGFAEFTSGEGVHFGVVDVPGHEGFIRNMLAGATGMDMVLLVVAADEGVMPQTREHLAIVRLLDVPALAVALTKIDLVEPEWMELVEGEIREILSGTRYSRAPILRVSARTGEGLGDLVSALGKLALDAQERASGDVARLPLDRVFTIRGAGTVVTGTLWSGTLRLGERVRILPGDKEARVRSLQVHGRQVDDARAGSRVAVGLSGSGISHQELERGQALVQGGGWKVSSMLTCRISVLEDSRWDLEQGQRVRVHLGTSEVLARAALMEEESLGSGEEGWVQLRLEAPILARVRDRLVLRTYSPVTTLGGGVVAEVLPRKRRALAPGEGALLRARLSRDSGEGVMALLEMEGWNGVPRLALPQRTGLSPGALEEAVARILAEGRGREVEEVLFSRGRWEEGRRRLLEALDEYHRREPLRPGRPLEELRQVLPGSMGPRLAEAIIQGLSGEGTLELRRGFAALAGFCPTLSPAQEVLRGRIRSALQEAGLAPPSLRELTAELGGEGSLVEALLRVMEGSGEVVALEDGLFFRRDAVVEAGTGLVGSLGGADNLGPSDFRDALPLTRKHLLPLLRYFDTVGITTRRDENRSVARELPKGWADPLPGL